MRRLNAEKAHVDLLAHVCAAEFEKKKQMLAERREATHTSSRQLVKVEEPFHNLQSKIADVRTRINE